ncbi:PilN domain-containing protein [Nostocaceae cyanobacterium CENA369]|uniref:PilN domain-containing protein n=1 Tax=Dendronalium phyllosphericum CENA369 TaxID=1725256 RepID=A0A8J7LG61_9NOST|nr:PilN domain-containing protein [Dendronalium phyllosphericum]MBH8575936.1 PilN domain-containing protein [Dendronalium phyllosphericum CENA369]
MYSLDINFLKDRPIFQNKPNKRGGFKLPVGDLTPIYIGVALGVCLPIFAATGWWFLQAKNSELEQNIAQLDGENKKLDAEIGNINKIREDIAQVKAQTQSLVSVFDQIRPWSAMLQDLRDRIPATVQIDNVKQIPPTPAAEGKPPNNPAGGIQINGLARSYNDVNDFLLTLQQSPFLKSSDSKIISANLVDAPIPPSAGTTTNVPIKPPQIVRYTIQSSLSDIPASELMRELEQKGTVGLVTRIRSMQQIGVITK